MGLLTHISFWRRLGLAATCLLALGTLDACRSSRQASAAYAASACSSAVADVTASASATASRRSASWLSFDSLEVVVWQQVADTTPSAFVTPCADTATAAPSPSAPAATCSLRLRAYGASWRSLDAQHTDEARDLSLRDSSVCSSRDSSRTAQSSSQTSVVEPADANRALALGIVGCIALILVSLCVLVLRYRSKRGG